MWEAPVNLQRTSVGLDVHAGNLAKMEQPGKMPGITGIGLDPISRPSTLYSAAVTWRDDLPPRKPSMRPCR
jgi:hypothetical protein